MEIKTSDRLKLRVDALRLRLDETTRELESQQSAAADVREQLHSVAVEALMEGRPQPPEVATLKSDLTAKEAAIQLVLDERVSLEAKLLDARRQHLRQLKQEKPHLYISLD